MAGMTGQAAGGVIWRYLFGSNRAAYWRRYRFLRMARGERENHLRHLLAHGGGQLAPR